MVYAEALVQLHFVCMAEVRARLPKVDIDKLDHKSDPIRVYLEVVTSDPTEGSSSSVTVFTSDPSTRPFMRNVTDSTRTVEYRMWFVLLEGPSHINYANIMANIIEQNGDEYQSMLASSKSSKRRKTNKSSDSTVCTFMGGSQGATEFGQSLGDTEKWKLIHNWTVYANAVDSLYGLRLLSTEDRLHEIHDRSRPFTSNPANPCRVFNPRTYFMYPTQGINDVQRSQSSYLANGAWIFPKPDHVVSLNANTQVLERFRIKMLPDYQARYYDETVTQTYLQASKRPRRQIAQRQVEEGVIDDLDFLGLGDEDDEADASEAAGPGEAMNQPVEPIMQDGAPLAYDSTFLAQEDFEDLNSLEARRLLSPTDSPDRSAFHRIRFEGACLRNVLIENATSGKYTTAELRHQYTEIQRTLITRYEDQCGRSSSDISDAGKKLNEWFSGLPEEERWLGQVRPIVFENLSIFGNLIARYLLRYENAKFVSVAHSQALLFHLGSRDAYNHDTRDVKFNGVIRGPASVSKSFILTLMVELSVPDTITEGMEATTNSAFIDYDKNDVIVICEEAPTRMMSNKAKSGGDATEEARFKDILTSQKCQKSVTVFHPDGSRDERRTYSQRIQVYFFATNDEYYMYSKPILSRFYKTEAHNRARPERSIGDLVGVEKRLDENGHERIRIFTQQMYANQFLHYHIEKLIAIQALCDVSTPVFDACKSTIMDHLKKHFTISGSPRDITRVRLIVRKLVIEHAIEVLYCHPLSKYYKQPFQMHQLADIDPLLHDTEEIVYFAFSWLRDQFISREQMIVLDAIRKLYLEVPHADIANQQESALSPEDLFLNPATPIHSEHNSGFSSISNDTRMPSGSGNFGGAFSRSNSSVIPQGRMNDTTGSVPAMLVGAASAYGQSAMYSYLRIPHNAKTISRNVSMHLQDTSEQLDFKAVYGILVKLQQGNIRSYGYAWDADAQIPRRRTGSLRQMECMLKSQRDTFVHLDLLEPNIDPLDNAIRACYHQFRTQRVQYIDGVEVAPEYPYAFRIREIAPSQGRPQQFTDHARVIRRDTQMAFEGTTGGSAPINDAVTQLTCAYDELSERDRARTLYLDDPLDCSYEVWERSARSTDGDNEAPGLADQTAVYPWDIMRPADMKRAQVEHVTRNKLGTTYRSVQEEPHNKIELIFVGKARPKTPPPSSQHQYMEEEEEEIDPFEI